MENTLVIIKPDAVSKKVVGDIIKAFDDFGLKLVALKMIKPSKETIEQFYSIHKGKVFFEPLVEFMNCGPIVVCVWQSDNVVSKVRDFIGATDSQKAESGTIRNLFGTNNRKNAVHASDSTENAKNEIAFFFKPEEILEYNYNAWINK
jgi:nucleoside-diphosphate kinase